MRSALRWRHYCDHCTKSTGTKASMIKHESRCTLNPGRVCNMCRIAGFDQKPMAELKAALNKGFKALLEAAENCPACTLAAWRQWSEEYSKDGDMIPWDHPATREQSDVEWDFKKACSSFWAEYGGRNDDNYY